MAIPFPRISIRTVKHWGTYGLSQILPGAYLSHRKETIQHTGYFAAGAAYRIPVVPTGVG